MTGTWGYLTDVDLLTVAVKDLTDSMGLMAENQKKAKEALEKSTRATKSAINTEKDLTDKYAKRNAALQKSIPVLNKMGKQFELLNYQSYKTFTALEQGGNAFDYLDLALSSVSEQVKVMGLEVSLARKVMYGFLPPGMFGTVNKFSTVFRILGSTVRAFKGDLEGSDNVLKKVGRGLGFLTRNRSQRVKAKEMKGKRKEDVKDMENSMSVPNKILSKAMSSDSLDEDDEDYEKVKALREQVAFKKANKNRLKGLKKLNKDAAKDFTKAAKAKRIAAVTAEKRLANVNLDMAINADKMLQHHSDAGQEKRLKDIKEALLLKEKLTKEYYALEEALEASIVAKIGDRPKTRHGEYYMENDPKNDAWKAKREKAITNMKDSTDPDDMRRVGELTDKSKEQHAASAVLGGLVDKDNDEKDLVSKIKARIKVAKNQKKWNVVRIKLKKHLKMIDMTVNSLKGRLALFLSGGITAMILGMAMLIAGLVVIKALWPSIKKGLKPMYQIFLMSLDYLLAGLSDLWEGISLIWDSVFGDGTLMEMFEGLWLIALGLWKVVWGLIGMLLGSLLGLLAGIILDLWLKAVTWVKSLKNDIASIGKLMGLLLAIAGMFIAFVFGAPILIIVAIGILLYKVGKWVVSKFDFFASGGVTSTPLQIVGEKGPELVNLPKGSRVHSNADSKKMVGSGGGGTVNNFNITINAKDTSDTEMRRIADKIGNMVSNKINRRTSSGTMR